MEKEKKRVRGFYKIWGKRFSVIVTAAFFLLLVVCTLFGEKLYTWITPSVSALMPKMAMYESGEKYTQIPKRAVTAKDTVYVVISEAGFSRKIYRIKEVEIEYRESEEDPSGVLVTTRLPQGCLIVTESLEGKCLKDGEKVLLKK